MENQTKYVQFTDRAPLIEMHECEKCHIWSIHKECKNCVSKEKSVDKI